MTSRAMEESNVFNLDIDLKCMKFLAERDIGTGAQQQIK